MVDSVTSERRSEIMGLVRSKHTTPELVVRRLVRAMGYRYRLHRRDIPGTPDLAFIGRRKVINVHGCFWHAHSCALGRTPKSRVVFWKAKFEANKARDERVAEQLMAAGWEQLVIWECELADVEPLESRIRRFLDA